MKKLSIVLLAVFFIGISNINAQTDATTETVVAVEEVQVEHWTDDITLDARSSEALCIYDTLKFYKLCEFIYWDSLINILKHTSLILSYISLINPILL